MHKDERERVKKRGENLGEKDIEGKVLYEKEIEYNRLRSIWIYMYIGIKLRWRKVR